MAFKALEPVPPSSSWFPGGFFKRRWPIIMTSSSPLPRTEQRLHGRTICSWRMLRRSVRLPGDTSGMDEDPNVRDGTRHTIVSIPFHEIGWEWHWGTKDDESRFEWKLYCRIRTTHPALERLAIFVLVRYVRRGLAAVVPQGGRDSAAREQRGRRWRCKAWEPCIVRSTSAHRSLDKKERKDHRVNSPLHVTSSSYDSLLSHCDCCS